jgi:hypothetical protein
LGSFLRLSIDFQSRGKNYKETRSLTDLISKKKKSFNDDDKTSETFRAENLTFSLRKLSAGISGTAKESSRILTYFENK